MIRQTIDNQRLTPVPIEARAVLASWGVAADELTLYSSTQIPHFLRTFIAVICGIPESRCRVIAPDVGGGFGAKLNTYAEEYAIAQASKLVGAPVKWIEDRSEAMVATIHGRDQLQHVELAADREGRVQAIRIELIQDYGAYLQFLTPSIAHLTVFMVPGAYDIQQVDITCRGVFTNTTPTDAYRGAGRPEATHMIERMMDLLADELGLDPAEVRRRNLIREFPYASATGLSYDSGNYEGALDKALGMADYEGFEARRTESRSRGNHRGIGLSTWVEICGLAPSAVTHAIGIGAGGWESSILRLHPTGTATVITGSSAARPGPRDDVVADRRERARHPVRRHRRDPRRHALLALRHRDVRLALARRRRHRAAALVREGAGEGAAARGAHARVLGGRPRVGGRQVVGQGLARAREDDPGARRRRLDGELLPEGMEPNLDATTFFDPPNFTFPFGTHIAELEIDGETGKITIERYTAVDDCGNVVNPMIVDGQVHGGIAQSIAQALYEETVYDDDGQILTGSLVDYMIPSAAEMPHFDLARTVTPSPTNPLGVKGIGEAGTIAATAAVVNAAVDALSHLGVKHLEMPLQPARVWQAMQKGGDA